MFGCGPCCECKIKLLLRTWAHFYPSSYPGRGVSRNVRPLPPESALFNNLQKNNSWGWGCISAKNTGRTNRNIFCLLRVVISHSPHVPLCVHSVLKRDFFLHIIKQIHRTVCGILSLLFRMSSTNVTRLPGRREQRLRNVHRPQCGPTVQVRGILRCCLRFRSKFLSKYGIWYLEWEWELLFAIFPLIPSFCRSIHTGHDPFLCLTWSTSLIVAFPSYPSILKKTSWIC